MSAWMVQGTVCGGQYAVHSASHVAAPLHAKLLSLPQLPQPVPVMWACTVPLASWAGEAVRNDSTCRSSSESLRCFFMGLFLGRSVKAPAERPGRWCGIVSPRGISAMAPWGGSGAAGWRVHERRGAPASPFAVSPATTVGTCGPRSTKHFNRLYRRHLRFPVARVDTSGVADIPGPARPGWGRGSGPPWGSVPARRFLTGNGA